MTSGAFTSNATGQRQWEIILNGSTFQGRGAQYIAPNPNAATIVQVTMPVISVVPGDYFEVFAFQQSGGNLDILAATTTWFAMEIVE
jgi:hypothetical protein